MATMHDTCKACKCSSFENYFKCKKYTFFRIQPKYVLLFNSSKYNHNSEHAAIYINTILLTQAKTVYHNNSDGIFQSHVFMN
jgi:hypothetical protein